MHDGDMLAAGLLQQLVHPIFRKARVASLDCQENPSLVTRLNLSQLNIGWFQRGKRFMICHAKNAENAAKSTVNSNMIGKNAGTVKRLVGLPMTMSG